jgi:hypothetical protein
MRDLERELRELGAVLAFPATPDLASRVRGRLPERGARSWPHRLVLVAAVLGAAVIAGLAIPQARSAIFRVFGIGAVRIEYVDRLPAVKPDVPLDLGTTITPQEAPFRPFESPLLGKPDGLYLAGDAVTLLYGSPENVSLLVTQIGYRALRLEIVKKVVGATTNTRVVTVGGSSDPAVWIEGQPHVFVLPDTPERLAANTLVWTRGNRTLRLEGAATLDEALRIAESFR